MHSSLTAAVLCMFVHAASAQCVPAAPAANDARAATETAKSPSLAAPAAAAHHGRELIKTAAAGTRDEPALRETPRTPAPSGEDHPHRGGTAMLLAALALMSGIALRRFGAPGQ